MKVGDKVKVKRTHTTNNREIKEGEIGSVTYLYKSGFATVWLAQDKALHLLKQDDLAPIS